MDELLARLTRPERRRVLKSEATIRKSGQWGAWQTLTFPPGTVGRSGWVAEFTIAHKNRAFSVLERGLPSGVRHFAVTSLSETRPTWPEMQRIKDELAGEETTAVEVYPPRGEIVDGANMYHLWVLADPLPFGLFHWSPTIADLDVDGRRHLGQMITAARAGQGQRKEQGQ